jgi:hypothetical protein
MYVIFLKGNNINSSLRVQIIWFSIIDLGIIYGFN